MKQVICFLIMFSLVSCTADESICRSYRCSFIFDTTLHPQPCHLTGILGNSGHFCKVSTSISQGVTHLKTTRNYDGATEDVALSTAKESQINFALGANNSLIIGTSTYDFTLKAYDGQCPNCLSDYNGINYPLTWQNNGQQLHCAKCGRSYDVNNGVVAEGASGRQLLMYMASYDGSVLRAWN